MAYRQLLAVTFAALVWVTVGCGGGGASAAHDAVDDQLPTNPDQPTNNSDQHASNPDQAPLNPDQPPGNTDGLVSGAGDAEGACRSFCASIDGKDCTGASALGGITRLVCASGCVLSTEDLACASQIAAAISCLSGLAGLCSDDFKAAQAEACQSAFDAASACDDAQNP